MNSPATKDYAPHRILDSPLIAILAVAIVYAVAAKLSFRFTIPPGNVSPIFPSAGIALAAALILGRKALPGVWLGSFAANAISFFDGTVSPVRSILPNLLIAALIGLGATGGAAAGAGLVRRCCHNEPPLYSGKNVLLFIVVGALGCCLISATFGVLCQSVAGYIPWRHFGYSWITWWAGDATGTIIAAPLILAWHQPHPFRRSPRRIAEAALLGGLTIVLCYFIFFRTVPFAYSLMPLLLWAAFRFGLRGASTTAAAIAILATIGACHGGSPFVQRADRTTNEILLSLHSFLDVTIVCALFLAGMLAERKQAQVELRESETRYRFLFEHNPMPMLIYERGTLQMLAVNEAFLIHYGYSPVELLALRLTDLYPEEEKVKIAELIPRLRGHANVGEWHHRKHDGSFLTNIVFSHDLEYQGRNARVAVMTDITERKRIEEELRATQASLEERVFLRTTELAEAKERAESADRLKSAFLATMSHELRTPLNSIIGFTGIILRGLAGPLNAEQAKQLGMVQASARHLLSLINDVLDISKIEAGQLEIHPEPFDLPATLEKVAALVKPLAEKKGLFLRVALPADWDQTAVVSDRLRVEQVLLNLLNNAVKFTEHGGVTLEAQLIRHHTFPKQTAPEPAARLCVADTGIGIKPEDMEKIFKPFRQIDSGLTRRHEGTGLGLAICRRLADQLGAEVSAASTWGEGSVFTFVLPLNHRHQP
jgi:PAS domain S-box-containing protein